MPRLSDRARGGLYGLASAWAAAVMMIGVHAARESFGSPEIILHRALISLLVLTPVMRRRDMAGIFSRRARLVWLRVLLGTGAIWLYIYALQLDHPAKVSAYFATTPLLVLMLARFMLGERLNRGAFVGVATVVGGLALLKAPLEPQTISDLAFALCLVGALLRASSYITLKLATATHSSRLLVWCLSFGMLATGLIAWPGTSSVVEFLTSGELWLISGASVVMQLTLANSYRLIRASEAVMIEETATIWTAFLAVFALGQIPSTVEIAAYLLIFYGNVRIGRS